MSAASPQQLNEYRRHGSRQRSRLPLPLAFARLPGRLASSSPLPLTKSFSNFGGVGSGNAFKLIYNVMGAIQVAAIAAAMQACETAGIDLMAAANAFSIGDTNSGLVIRHSKYSASGKHESPVGFSPKGRIKDTLCGVDFIEKVGGQSRLGRTTVEVFGQAVEVGMGDQNDSERIDALQKVYVRSQ
jgi:3-hydroxyisobutyrate dehydrogenase